MATVSATQSISTITPPSSSHGAGSRGPWDYAVPIDSENTYMDEKPYMPGSNQPIQSAYHLRQPLAQQTNGTARMTESQPLRPPFGPENEYLTPARPNPLGRKKSDISHDSSDPDNSLDTYKTGPGSKSVPYGIDKSGKRKPPNGVLNGKKSPEEDANNWIHRDKLAVIESKELEEAGFIGRVSRSASRTTALAHPGRQDPVQEPAFESVNDGSLSKEDVKRQRTISPTPGSDDNYEAAIAEWDLRTPEEIAADQEGQYFVQAMPARLNGSRLPLPKHSPVPVPLKIVDRDSPLTRSRNSSTTYNNTPTIELRPRSRSNGSQAMLVDDEPPLTPTFHKSTNSDSDRSPPKTKGTTKATPNSGARKPGAQPRVVSTSKPRVASQSSRESPQKRPGTSSGLARPSTGHRPEGDPPWIASMYKPDPRLPPDQQILPTHARRMAQEQWEKEGKTGTVYDREFRLLNTEEITQPEQKPLPELRHSQVEDRTRSTVLSNWNLGTPPLGSPRSLSNDRPGTGGTEHGGYRTMPTIHSPTPTPGSPIISSKPTSQPVRLQEPPSDDSTEKKGCGACCIVM